MAINSASGRIAESIIADYMMEEHVGVGDKLPSVRQLGAKYGASSHTVVHAIQTLVERGLIEKRRGSGCYIANSDKSEERPTSCGDEKVLGFIITNRQGEIITRMLSGVDRACTAQGWKMMVASSEQDYELEHQHADSLLNAGCKGLVIFPVTRTRQQMDTDYLKLAHRDSPIALIDLAYPEQKHIQVVFDNWRLGRDMTEVLIKQGHKRIAFMDIGSSEYKDIHMSTHDRYLGYLDALTAAGLESNPEDRWMFRKTPVLGAPELIAPTLINWMQQKDRPTAVIAIDDSAAVEIIAVAKELGIKMPEELEFVGFDNLRDAMACSELSWTSAPDFIRAGEMAAELLIQRINSDETRYVLPVPVKQCRSRLLQERCRVAIESSCEDLGLDMGQLCLTRK